MKTPKTCLHTCCASSDLVTSGCWQVPRPALSLGLTWGPEMGFAPDSLNGPWSLTKWGFGGSDAHTLVCLPNGDRKLPGVLEAGAGRGGQHSAAPFRVGLGASLSQAHASAAAFYSSWAENISGAGSAEPLGSGLSSWREPGLQVKARSPQPLQHVPQWVGRNETIAGHWVCVLSGLFMS